MRTGLAFLLSSPIIAPFLHLAHVEALLLLPRNQGIRQRYKVLVREYSRIHFDRSDPYWDDVNEADNHPDVIAAHRPILAIEAMITDGRHQAALANYRKALFQGDREEIVWIEANIAAILELQPDSGGDGPLHAVG